MEELLKLSKEMCTLDNELHRIQGACARFMEDTHRHSLDQDLLAIVQQRHDDILDCEHIVDYIFGNEIGKLGQTESERARSQAASSEERLQWALAQALHCTTGVVRMRQALIHRELQLRIVGARVVGAEVHLDLAVWTNSILQTATRFISRHPWSAGVLEEVASPIDLATAGADETELVPLVAPAARRHIAATGHHDQSVAGGCMICMTDLVGSSNESRTKSLSELVVCQTCKQALHLGCVITWWRTPVEDFPRRECPLCRGDVTDEVYIDALESYTALVEEKDVVEE